MIDLILLASPILLAATIADFLRPEEDRWNHIFPEGRSRRSRAPAIPQIIQDLEVFDWTWDDISASEGSHAEKTREPSHTIAK